MGPDHAPVAHPAAVARWASRPLRYVDRLKVILIAAIIAGLLTPPSLERKGARV